MHILVATDVEWVLDELRAALDEPGTTFAVVRDGRAVAAAVKEAPPDIAILDLQVGSMGGMATTMSLRLDESSGRLPRVPVVMLLDRSADVHLARRSAADGWLIKPLDPFRLRAAVGAVVGGGTYVDGAVPADAASGDAAGAGDPEAAAAAETESAPPDGGDDAEMPNGEPAATG